VSFSRGLDSSPHSITGPRARIAFVHEEERRARSGRLGTGTLACRRCDAPVAPGAVPLSLTDRLVCPFCRYRAPVRDFLSLAAPVRPARVAICVRPID
jgi:hypothetical protein